MVFKILDEAEDIERSEEIFFNEHFQKYAKRNFVSVDYSSFPWLEKDYTSVHSKDPLYCSFYTNLGFVRDSYKREIVYSFFRLNETELKRDLVSTPDIILIFNLDDPLKGTCFFTRDERDELFIFIRLNIDDLMLKKLRKYNYPVTCTGNGDCYIYVNVDSFNEDFSLILDMLSFSPEFDNGYKLVNIKYTMFSNDDNGYCDICGGKLGDRLTYQGYLHILSEEYPTYCLDCLKQIFIVYSFNFFRDVLNHGLKLEDVKACNNSDLYNFYLGLLNDYGLVNLVEGLPVLKGTTFYKDDRFCNKPIPDFFYLNKPIKYSLNKDGELVMFKRNTHIPVSTVKEIVKAVEESNDKLGVGFDLIDKYPNIDSRFIENIVMDYNIDSLKGIVHDK